MVQLLCEIVWKLKHFVSLEMHKVALWGGNNIWVNFKSVTIVKQQFREKKKHCVCT